MRMACAWPLLLVAPHPSPRAVCLPAACGLSAASYLPASCFLPAGRYLPIRAKYCKKHGRVVAKFDHYCYVIGNSIGELNHGRFYRLVCAQVSSARLRLGSRLVHVHVPVHVHGMCMCSA